MSTIKQTNDIISLLRQLATGAGAGQFGNAIFFDEQPATAKPNDVSFNTTNGEISQKQNDNTWTVVYNLDVPETEYITKIAGEDINSFRVVKIISNEFFYYQPSDLNDYNRAIGLSTKGVVSGSNLKVITQGLITTSFSLTPNSVYFASTNGQITNTPPTTGLCTEIGYSISNSELYIDIKDTTQLI